MTTREGPLPSNVVAIPALDLAWVQRQWLGMAVDAFPLVAWTTDADLVITAAGGDALTRLGIDPTKVVGYTMQHSVGSYDPASPLVVATRRALAGDTVPYELEWAGCTWQGRIAPLRDTEAQVVGSIGVALNVTHSRATERALLQTETLFHQMESAIREVFWLSEPHGQPIYVSPAFEAIWGRKPQDVLARPSLFMETVHPDDRERIAAAAGRAAVSPLEQEYRIVRPDGAIRWIRDRGFPIRDGNGKTVRLAGIAADVTDRRQIEEQMLQMQKMDALGRLAGGVAHDFNNTLTVILGCAEALEAGVAAGPPQVELAQQIVQACGRASALVQRLLLFSRNRPFEPRPVNLNHLVSALSEMLRRLLGKSIKLNTQLDPQLWSIMADQNNLEQLLINLVVNARDAMPDGGHIWIETINHADPAALPAGASHQPYVQLSVRDDGTGIPADVLPRIFEPFFTTKPVGRGTGLGLSTVHGIVKQLDGHIDVRSEPGNGARFSILIPALTSQASTDVGAGAPAAAPRRAGLVLVAEDEPEIRGMIVQVLRKTGYTVVEAADGQSAWEVIESHNGKFDLLLTDVVMPRMGGADLVNLVSERFPTIKILCMSGYSETQARLPTRAVIAKPFMMAALLERIDALLAADGRQHQRRS